jgi:3-hydroxyisobutyrate dehydrogenase-like beta-hydroxyacid dehydrogenase
MKVGFVGVGMMGGPMCRNVLKGGHEVVVYDLNPDALSRVSGSKTTVAASPKAVAEQVSIVFTSLPMPADVEQVVLGENGLAAGAKKGAIFCDLSTNAPAVVKRLEKELAGKGITFLDAPVSGGVDGAEAATLAIMVGGQKKAFDTVKPVLDCMGKNVFLVGPIGSGSIAKLCNNMVSFCNLAVASEALMLATRAGLNPRMMADVMTAASGNSNSLKRLTRKGLRGDWAQEFALNLAHKDLTLALELGRQSDTPLPYGSYTYTLLQQGRLKGWGKDDVGVLLRVLESALGTEVRE